VTARPLDDRGQPGGASATMLVLALKPTAPLLVVDLDYCVFASQAKRAWLGRKRRSPGQRPP